MKKYIDAHTHLSKVRDIDPNTGVIINAAKISDWEDVIAITHSSVNANGAIGVHPWYASDLPIGWDKRLHDLLIQHPKLQIGEIGLDKKRPNFEIQTAVFKTQLELAHSLNRGIQLHCVGAWDVMLNILSGLNGMLPPYIIAHEFSGPIPEIEKMAKKYNMYFSYGPRSIRNHTRILSTPQNRILSETDDTPSVNIVDIVTKIANILNVAPDKMVDIIYNNTIQILNYDTTA